MPIPNGKVSVFRRSSKGELSYKPSLCIDYIPVDDTIELNLGHDPNVALRSDILSGWRSNIWLKLNRANAFKRTCSGNIVVDHRAPVAGWDQHAIVAQRIENFSGRPIDLQIRQRLLGDVTVRSALDPQRHDANIFDLNTTVPARETRELLYEIVKKERRNAKQQRVALEDATIVRPRYQYLTKSRASAAYGAPAALVGAHQTFRPRQLHPSQGTLSVAHPMRQ